MKKFLIASILLFVLCCTKKKCDNTLYGIPVNNTGLEKSKCTPSCACRGLESKQFTSIELEKLREYTLTNPFDEIVQNPYDKPLPIKKTNVCAVVIEDKNLKTYSLKNYSTEEEAKKAGGILTHHDACGACSTLKDLAVYAERLDLGADVRQCIVYNLNQPLDSLVLCIENLGLTKPCAQIWAYNAKNTQAECFDICIKNNTYNNKDGSLSDCLQCDEDKSGPVFKAVAGRTRRNTGIANAICRFCEEVEYVEHNYPLD